MKALIKIVFTSVLLNISSPLSAQYSKLWSVTFNANTNSYERPVDFAADTTGKFVYVLAQTQQMKLNGWENESLSMLLLKYNVSNGTFLWGQKNDSLQYPTAMYLDNNQNIYTCGYKSEVAGREHFFVAKYNSYGSFKWAKTYDDSITFGFYRPFSITGDDQHNIYIAGSYSENGDNGIIIKYDSLGNRIWVQKSITDTLNYFAGITVLKIDTANNLYSLSENFALAKYNSSGILQWNTKLPLTTGVYPKAKCFQMDNKGNSYIFGSVNNDTSAYILAKINSEGNLVWIKRDFPVYPSFGDWYFEMVLDVSQTSIYLNGVMDFQGIDALYKIDAVSGLVLWKVSDSTSSGKMLIDSNNNLLLLGSKYIDTKYILTLSLYDSTSEKLMEEKFDSPGSFYEHPVSMILGEKNSLLLLGSIDMNLSDILLARYIITSTGIKDVPDAELNFRIISNPFHSSTVLAAIGSLTESTILRLYDVTGRELRRIPITGKYTRIERGNLSSAIYFYTISNLSGIMQSGKLIVE